MIQVEVKHTCEKCGGPTHFTGDYGPIKTYRECRQCGAKGIIVIRLHAHEIKQLVMKNGGVIDVASFQETGKES